MIELNKMTFFPQRKLITCSLNSKEETKINFPRHAAKYNYCWTDRKQAAHIYLHLLYMLHLPFNRIQNTILRHWSFQSLKMLLGLTVGRKNWLLILLSVESSFKAMRWKSVVFYAYMTYKVVWIFFFSTSGTSVIGVNSNIFY